MLGRWKCDEDLDQPMHAYIPTLVLYMARVSCGLRGVNLTRVTQSFVTLDFEGFEILLNFMGCYRVCVLAMVLMHALIFSVYVSARSSPFDGRSAQEVRLGVENHHLGRSQILLQVSMVLVRPVNVDHAYPLQCSSSLRRSQGSFQDASFLARFLEQRAFRVKC